MAKLARTFDLLEPLRQRVKDGLPVLGTCAGMILLADRILDGAPGQETVGGLDVTVRRNAFGRQVDSFEGPVAGRRASTPRSTASSSARRGSRRPAPASRCSRASVTSDRAPDRIVMVRQGPLMATSFHPEVGDDPRVHGMFVDLVTQTPSTSAEEVGMSGHSKWATTKHKKAALDSKRSKLTTKLIKNDRGRRAHGRR